MQFPVKTCVACGEEFELKSGKPGFANRCPECSSDDEPSALSGSKLTAEERKVEAGANDARRQAIRELLYTRQ